MNAPSQPTMRRWEAVVEGGVGWPTFIVYAPCVDSARLKLLDGVPALEAVAAAVAVRELPRVEDEPCNYIDGRAAPGQ
jgi:hypothetical protein